MDGWMDVSYAPIALLIIPGRRDPPLCVAPPDFFLANEGIFFFLSHGGKGQGGAINIWPVKALETVPVIKGSTRTNVKFSTILSRRESGYVFFYTAWKGYSLIS